MFAYDIDDVICGTDFFDQFIRISQCIFVPSKLMSEEADVLLLLPMFHTSDHGSCGAYYSLLQDLGMNISLNFIIEYWSVMPEM